MKFLMIILTSLAQTVLCTSVQNFAINDPPLPNDPFLTVWNAPSEKCLKKYGVFLNLTAFDIAVNPAHQFIGDVMTIFYHYQLGKFPFFLPDGRAVNGGLPQLGNLTAHLEQCKKDFRSFIPDVTFGGLAVIDLEMWLGLWEFNFGVRSNYKNKSIELVERMHPTWNKSQLVAEAKIQFDTAARKYMESTLLLARAVRPGGHWGYYHYPYCYNRKVGQSHCDLIIRERNDQMSWLYRSSASLYPSVYLSTTIPDAASYIYGTLEESFRIAYNDTTSHAPGVFLYSTYGYTDQRSKFYTEADLIKTFKQAADFGSSGVVVWGSHNDFTNKSQCIALQAYLNTTLGPFIKNITNYTRTCSQKVCSNHGRCQRKDLMALLDLSESIAKISKSIGMPDEPSSRYLYFRTWHQDSMVEYLRGVQLEFNALFQRTIRQLSSWMVKSDDYTCRCYSGWGGESCDKRI
ncbi:hyaluronidase-like [Lineus longissimus]|uniref:hyaluronidase-like n=1 Tax=Lineus longissimus TaxID=88925 RepID=UPI00315D451D